MIGRYSMSSTGTQAFAVRAAIHGLWLLLMLAGLGFGKAVSAAPQLQLTMTASVTTVAANTQFTYTLQYQCASITDNCAAATVSDVLPAALSGNAADVTLVGSAHTTATAYTATTRTAKWTFVNPLPAGSTGQLQLSVKFPVGTTPNGATAVNSATMSATGAATATSNPVTVTATATNAWTLAKTRVSGGTGAALDQDVVYQIQACPTTSNVNLGNAVLTDTLPAGAVFVSANNGGTNASGIVTWNLGTLTATVGCYTEYLVLQYPSSAFSVGATVTNTATLNATIPALAGPASITPLTSSTSHLVSAPAPNKSVVKKSSLSSANVGQSISYDFDTMNTGNVKLDNFSIVDVIPPQLNVTQIGSGYSVYNITPTLAIEYQTNTNTNWVPVTGFPRTLGTSSYNVSVASLNLGTGVYITQLRYTYLTLPVGFKALGSSSGPNFQATVLATDTKGVPVVPGNVIANTGSYTYSYNGTAGSGSSAVNVTVSQATQTVTEINAVPKLDKAVSGTSTVLPGGTVTYQLTLNNASTAGATLVNPVLGDLLDAKLSYVANSATLTSKPTGMPNPVVETLANYNNTGRTLLRFRWDGASAYSLPVNASAVLQFKVTVNPGTLAGAIPNVAYLLGQGNAAISTANCYTPLPADTNDLNANGNKTETLCASKSSAGGITVGTTAAMESVLFVKGQLDANYVQYPSNGTTVAGGSLLYRLQVSNVGNVPMKNAQIIDILPFAGDTGVLDPQGRLSVWRPNLIAPVVAPTGVVVYYSTQANPCRTELGYAPTGCANPQWSVTPPADITAVQALKFDFGNVVVNPADKLQLDWPMRAPIGAPTKGEIAWNSFGFVATRADNAVALLPSEPLKVGVAVQPPSPPVYNGLVWLDNNGNGLQDTAETGLNGVRVDLYQSNGTQADSTITTSDGNGNPGHYQFTNLVPGSYYALFYPPAGYAVTKQNAGSNPALNSAVDPTTNSTGVTALTYGQVYGNGNMGLQVSATGSVGNYVWFDRNGNGIQDEATNDGINGVTVKVYSTVNSSTPVATAVTANDLNNNPGYYRVDGLAPGSYFVEFGRPAGASFTALDAANGNEQIDADANLTTGRTVSFSLVAGQYDATWDAGVLLPVGSASLGDRVWLDVNNNGIYEPLSGELGVDGIRVNLYRDTDGNGAFTPGTDQYYTTSTTFTSGGYPGFYSFAGLPAGAYIVQIDPMNFVSGKPLAGLLASSLAASPVGGVDNTNNGYLLAGFGALSKAVTLGSNALMALDFGFIATYSIGNRVFKDDGSGSGVANDGIQNGDEPGIAGVVVHAYLSAADGTPAGSPVASAQTTDGSGYYRFDGLPAGNYVIAVDQAGSSVLQGLVSSSGYSSSFALSGDLNDHGIDAPLNAKAVLPGGIASLPVTLAVGGQPVGESLGSTSAGQNGPNGDGSNNLVVDFGFTPSYSLGNRVFRDDGTGGGTMDNGRQDGGEPGIAGVAVKLFQSDADGNPTGSLLAAQATDASGYYRFDSLPAGNYVVIVDQAGSAVLGQMVSSTGGSASFALTGDLQDHGIDTPLPAGAAVPGGIATAKLSLGAGAEPVGESLGATGAGLNGPTGDAGDNLAADFGFVPTHSLGNRIWIDNGAGGGTVNDGILNGGEPAAPAGVAVELLDGTGAVVATAATDGSGYYRFDGLRAGVYSVRVADANFMDGGKLAGHKPSAGAFADVAGVAGNNRSHGQAQGGHVVGPAVTLGAANPLGDADGAQPTAAAKNGPNGDAYDNLLADFGFTPVYSLGNLLWLDNGAGGGTANDGILNGTEPPVPAGVSVELLDGTATTVIAATTTDASGYYRFDQLVGGVYVVRVADANFVDGGKLMGYLPSAGYFADVASSGPAANNRNHGRNTNGHLVSAAVTLGLTNPTGEADPVQATPMAQNGPAGDASDNLLVDFGFAPAYSLGDSVWFDANQDGIQQPEEKGIAGVTVKLYAADGVTLVQTTQTDGTGAYRFEGLAGGSYIVGFAQPAGYQFSPQNQGTGSLQDSFDSDADANTGKTAVVALTGSATPTVDAGLYLSNGAKPAGIADWVWYDTNQDGLQSAGEPGLAGVTVKLWDGGHAKQLASTVSDGLGGYAFAGLPAGTYMVEFVAPAGYVHTAYKAVNGSKDATDSDAAVDTGLTAAITLAAGQGLNTVDAGLYLAGTSAGTGAASIGDKVWYDSNNNGLQDAGEPGIPGVSVRLYDAAGVSLLAKAKTSATGTYVFGGLAAGTYALEFVAPNANYRFSPQSQGASSALDSDADAANGWVAVTVAAGQNRPDIDAGLSIANALPLSVGDSVWLDGDHSLKFNVGEGLANAQVVLYDGLGRELARQSTTAADANYLFAGLGQGSYRVAVDRTSLPGNAVEIADPDAALDSATDLVGLTTDTTAADFGYSTQIDFGDLPDGYATLLASNGPRHAMTGVYLGAGSTDAEADGQPVADASGDNAAGATPNDEDGVSMADLWVAGQNAVIKVTASAAGVLNAWADWNNNGAFESGERFLADQALAAGANSLTVAIPANAADGPVAVRFRATNAVGQAGDSPTGLAANGEVEDYFTKLYAANKVGSIVGEVRNDTKGDGNLAAGYAGLAGATVSLYTDPNGDGNPADGALLNSAVTDATGVYSFAKLLPGNYVVVESNPAATPAFVSTNDAAGPNDDSIPVVLAAASLTATGRDFLDNQPQPPASPPSGTGSTGTGGTSSTGGTAVPAGPAVSKALTDGVNGQCVGLINLLKDATPQELEGLRKDNGGSLVFGFKLNEVKEGTETARSEGVSVKNNLTLIVNLAGGTQKSYSIADGACHTETYSLLAETGGTKRNPAYTLTGSDEANRQGAQNAFQNGTDSTLKCAVPASLQNVTGATLAVNFLQTDVARGDPEAYYDCTGKGEQVNLLNAADTQFVDTYQAGRTLAPAVALTNPAPVADPLAVTSWNSFPSGSTFYFIAYEDMYPAQGDYDFNDAVVAYQVQVGLNSNNQVVKIVGNAYLLAKGAAYSHDWHLRIGLPPTAKAAISCTTSLHTTPQTDFACAGTNPLASTGTADVTVFADTLKLFPNAMYTDYRKPFANTLQWPVEARAFQLGPKSTFSINLAQPIDPAALGAAPFDPYLYVRDTKKTVQLLQVNPLIKDANGYPYAMLMPNGWNWPFEKVDIRTAYANFNAFTSSQGANAVDWYSFPAKTQIFPSPKQSVWAW